MFFLGDVRIRTKVCKSAELFDNPSLELCGDGRILSSPRVRPRMSAVRETEGATRKSKYDLTIDDNASALIGSSLLGIISLVMLIWKSSDWPINSTLPLYF
jgi:hypothetical protein